MHGVIFKRDPSIHIVPLELQYEIRSSDDEKYRLIATLILTTVLTEISEHCTVCRLQMLQIFLGITKKNE